LSAVVASRVEASSGKALSAVAWATLLCASGLGQIVWRVGFGGDETVWIAVVQFGLLLLLLRLVRTWDAVRPLTPFVSALAALGGGFVALLLLERAAGFTAWTERGPEYLVIPAQSALLCLPTLAMLAVAFGFGFGRPQLFLVRGQVDAPSRIPGTSRRLGWSRLGPLAMLLFAVPLCVQLAVTTRTDAHLLLRTLELLPLGIAFAAVNAAQEEVRFRAVPLALAVPFVGGERAIWMTATAFGLGHWFGHPSGPSGVALTLIAGLVLAKAMLETRGLVWPWAIHAVQDVLIFAFLVLGSN
jgi:membrane protease YdiL (CAAX protease family)